MPLFFYLPLIIARGMLSVSTGATVRSAEPTPRPHEPEPPLPHVTAPSTQPGFDELWLGASHPERR
jgi:hypothetical protein